MVNWRSTVFGIHWLGWVSFGTLIIGVAGMMTAIALPNFYSSSSYTDANGEIVTLYLGLWNMCMQASVNMKVYGSLQTINTVACFPIDAGCSTYNGLVSVVSNCSQFHALAAVMLIAVILGGLAVFANWAALAIMLAHGSISTFVVKMGGFILSAASGAMGLLAMILAINEKSRVFDQYSSSIGINFHASFAVLIVGWIFTIFSAGVFVISAQRCGGGFHDVQKRVDSEQMLERDPM